jgi:hypothetical protein
LIDDGEAGARISPRRRREADRRACQASPADRPSTAAHPPSLASAPYLASPLPPRLKTAPAGQYRLTRAGRHQPAMGRRKIEIEPITVSAIGSGGRRLSSPTSPALPAPSPTSYRSLTRWWLMVEREKPVCDVPQGAPSRLWHAKPFRGLLLGTRC